MGYCGETPEKKPTTDQAAPGLEPGTSRMQSGALGAWPQCSIPQIRDEVHFEFVPFGGTRWRQRRAVPIESGTCRSNRRPPATKCVLVSSSWRRPLEFRKFLFCCYISTGAGADRNNLHSCWGVANERTVRRDKYVKQVGLFRVGKKIRDRRRAHALDPEELRSAGRRQRLVSATKLIAASYTRTGVNGGGAETEPCGAPCESLGPETVPCVTHVAYFQAHSDRSRRYYLSIPDSLRTTGPDPTLNYTLLLH
jgi:hypothetical protein